MGTPLYSCLRLLPQPGNRQLPLTGRQLPPTPTGTVVIRTVMTSEGTPLLLNSAAL